MSRMEQKKLSRDVTPAVEQPDRTVDLTPTSAADGKSSAADRTSANERLKPAPTKQADGDNAASHRTSANEKMKPTPTNVADGQSSAANRTSSIENMKPATSASSSTGSGDKSGKPEQPRGADDAEVSDLSDRLQSSSIFSKKEPFPVEEVYAVEANEAEFDLDLMVPQAPRMYKIAMFAWESLHSVAVGGVAPHVTNLAAGLERRGHEVHVYVRSGSSEQAPYEVIDGVHVHRVSFDLTPDFVQEVYNMCDAMVANMLSTEAYMDTRFDVVHAHDWLAASAVIKLKKEHNRRVVFTVHSTEFGRCGNNVFGGESARIRGIEGEALGLADRAVGVSGVLCDEVKGHYSFDWEKLRCVHNGIECLPYDGNLWNPASVRGKYGVGPMDPMVLFVGRMATQKGPDILVEAIPSILATVPNAKFVLVGDGYMKDALIGRCHQFGCADAVRFTGSLSGQPLIELFKATDMVCIPSRNEPFGIVTLESWAANKPVVVTKNGGPREFVWHDNDGYVVDAEPSGIAWGIGTMFSNFEHARYMGARGRVKAAYQFSWNRIAEVTNNVYDELFGIFPPPPPPLKADEVPETKPAAAAIDEAVAAAAPNAGYMRKETVS